MEFGAYKTVPHHQNEPLVRLYLKLERINQLGQINFECWQLNSSATEKQRICLANQWKIRTKRNFPPNLLATVYRLRTSVCKRQDYNAEISKNAFFRIVFYWNQLVQSSSFKNIALVLLAWPFYEMQGNSFQGF